MPTMWIKTELPEEKQLPEGTAAGREKHDCRNPHWIYSI